ncbi:hypothetical protein D9757_009756 [Collybiopsis confluens]|uniref:DUF6534 domain-containing protein n=1 Tax=Collybiopsis confluens TaxID=2823264 RepID=A0A8H5LXN0_9AGAR|nr:hypothetical protein D9757_009756 [Collybiopsis confluens]
MAATDFMLAILLVIYLRQKDTRFQVTGKTPTNIVVANLITYTVGTGAVTGMIALIGVIVDVTATPTIGVAIFAAIPHTYSNAMLIILNTRKIIAKPFEATDMPPTAFTPIHFQVPGSIGSTTADEVGHTIHSSNTKTEPQLESGTSIFTKYPGSRAKSSNQSVQI